MNRILDREKYIPRILDETVDHRLSAFGAVCIEGPKWCGKTWTSSFHSNSEILIGDPANNFKIGLWRNYRRLWYWKERLPA